MSWASTCRMASDVPVTVAALTTSGMSTHAARSSSGAMVPWQNTWTEASVFQPIALRSTIVVKPRITPLSSMRSTRLLTAGADRFTRSPISANVARAWSASSARMRSSVPSRRSMIRYTPFPRNKLPPYYFLRKKSRAITQCVAIDCIIDTEYRLFHDDFRCRRLRGPGIRCRRNDAGAQCRRPTGSEHPDGPYPPLRHDGSDLLRRRVRHQPVDGHLYPRRHQCRDGPMGEPAPDL